MNRQKAWLGLGGNLGDVTAAMADALKLLNSSESISVTAVSGIYKTPPWGLEDQPWFKNCCAEIDTSLEPEALLEACQNVERAGKRERIVRWGPRTIDVDILIYDGVEQTEQRLTIPHPRITERAFVLVPLAEIAPNLMLNTETIADHAAAIEHDGIELENSDKNWWLT